VRYLRSMGDNGLLVDGVIILFYFVTITAIGLYMGRRERSLNDFALGAGACHGGP